MKKIFIVVLISITTLFTGCGNDKEIIENTMYISRFNEYIGPLFRELECVSHSANLINRYGYNELMLEDEDYVEFIYQTDVIAPKIDFVNAFVIDQYLNNYGLTLQTSNMLQKIYKAQLSQGDFPADLSIFQTQKEDEKWEIKKYKPTEQDKMDNWFIAEEKITTDADASYSDSKDKFYIITMSNDLIEAKLFIKVKTNHRIELNYDKSEISFKTSSLRGMTITMTSDEYWKHIVNSIGFDLAYQFYSRLYYPHTKDGTLDKRLEEIFEGNTSYVNPYYLGSIEN